VRSNKKCVYDVEPGKTRQAATKQKHKFLQEDYDCLLKIFESLHSGSLADAQDLLGRLRSSQDTRGFLNSVKAQAGSLPWSSSGKRCEDGLSSDSHRSESILSEVLPHWSGKAVVSPSNHSEVSKVGLQDDSASSERVSRWLLSQVNPVLSLGDILPGELELPSADFVRQAAEAFYFCSGKLFHVFDRDWTELNFQNVFHDELDRDARRVALCELCCVAAVGALYMEEQLFVEDRLYRISRALLTDAILANPLRAAKCCILLGMFNIMNKGTVALSYIETGMCLLRRFWVHTPHRPADLTQEEWLDGKRAWRTLLFFKCWMSATLGYVTSDAWWSSDLRPGDVEIEGETHIADIVQTEMVKIAILNQEILRINTAFDQSSCMSVSAVRRDLHQWHQDLPDEMRLHNLVHNPDITTDLRRTIYYVHLLYLGALMLIYRQTLHESQHLHETEPGVGGQTYLDAVAAAHQSARILSLLQEENGIFHRCWICIFQAYSAGTLILAAVARGFLQPQRHLVDVDLNLAGTCMDVLHFCAKRDTVAVKFYSLLQPYHDILRYRTTVSSTQLPYLSPELGCVATELFDLLRRPLGRQEDSRPATNSTCTGSGTGFMQFPRTIRAHELHATGPYGWKSEKSDDCVKNDGSLNGLVSNIRSPQSLSRFVLESLPCKLANDAHLRPH